MRLLDGVGTDCCAKRLDQRALFAHVVGQVDDLQPQIAGQPVRHREVPSVLASSTCRAGWCEAAILRTQRSTPSTSFPFSVLDPRWY